MSIKLAQAMAVRVCSRPPAAQIFLKIFRVPRNVVDNKGQEMRKMGQMRIPRNVYENTSTYNFYPGMLLINKVVKMKSGLLKGWQYGSCVGCVCFQEPTAYKASSVEGIDQYQ